MKRRASLLAIGAIMLVACTDGPAITTIAADSAAEPPPAVTSATISSTTTSLGPSPPVATSGPVAPATTANPTVPSLALPNNFGDDFAAIWDEIQGFIDRMSFQPDPSLVDVIIDPDCNCYQFWVDLFTELDDNDWHYVGEAVTSDVQVLVVTGDEVGLAVTQQVPASSVVDADGNVVREEEARVVTSSVALRRDEEGRWRIFNVVGS